MLLLHTSPCNPAGFTVTSLPCLCNCTLHNTTATAHEAHIARHCPLLLPQTDTCVSACPGHSLTKMTLGIACKHCQKQHCSSLTPTACHTTSCLGDSWQQNSYAAHSCASALCTSLGSYILAAAHCSAKQAVLSMHGTASCSQQTFYICTMLANASPQLHLAMQQCRTWAVGCQQQRRWRQPECTA